MAAEPILRLEGLTKRFPGVVALDGVDLDIENGEMHALAGENGAGKSSLIRLLAGIHRPDAGRMTLAGASYAPGSPLQAIRAGIRVVHQEFNLLPALSVAENLLFERLPRRRFGFVDRRAMDRDAEALLARVGLSEVSPRTPVERLGIAQMQLVEIARALSSQGRVLVLDEPTATLTPREAGRLFEQIRLLKQQGLSMIYVSHHLGEIFDLCDRVTVLRNGRKVETSRTADTDAGALVRQMIGRTLAAQPPLSGAPLGREALRVENLRPAGAPPGPGLSFGVRYGEILGEPTRGIDVGAKAEIYALLGKLAADGRAIVVVSSELPELMHLCDRILVLSRGRLAGEVARADFSEERILSLAYSQFMQTA